MPNLMVALLNIGGALCSTPQSLADAHYCMPCSNAGNTQNALKFVGVPKLPDGSQPLVARSSPYCGDIWRRYWCLTSFFSDCGYPVTQGDHNKPRRLHNVLAKTEVLIQFNCFTDLYHSVTAE